MRIRIIILTNFHSMFFRLNYYDLHYRDIKCVYGSFIYYDSIDDFPRPPVLNLYQIKIINTQCSPRVRFTPYVYIDCNITILQSKDCNQYHVRPMYHPCGTPKIQSWS